MTFFSDPEHIWIAVASGAFVLVASVVLAVIIFTRINRRILDAFMDQQRRINEEAVEARRKLLDVFLQQQRDRDEEIRREQRKRDADRTLRDEALETAWAHWFERVRLIENERLPAIQAEVRDINGRLTALEVRPKVLR